MNYSLLLPIQIGSPNIENAPSRGSILQKLREAHRRHYAAIQRLFARAESTKHQHDGQLS